MRVLLVGNYAPDGQKSMRQFCELLRDGLAARGHEVRVVQPRAYLPQLVDARRAAGKWLGYVNKFLLFPAVLRRAARWADVAHVCDHSNAMYVGSLRDRAHLVTCHDVIAIEAARGMVPGWWVGATGRLFQRLILRGLRRAQHVACVSAYTRTHLSALAPSTRANSSVVENGLNPELALADHAGAAAGQRSGAYLLHVGSSLPRKNRRYVVGVFAELLRRDPAFPHRLLFVGPPLRADETGPDLRDEVLDRIDVRSDVPAPMLARCYADASLLLFPSLLEGFGWPVIEAQALGCPVIASRREPMVDVGGEGALYVDPEDIGQGADAVQSMLADRAAWVSAGRANASRFSIERMIDGYEALYRCCVMERRA